MNIPDEAVEAGARAICRRNGEDWSRITVAQCDAYRADARDALNAALPYIMEGVARELEPCVLIEDDCGMAVKSSLSERLRSLAPMEKTPTF